MTADWTEYAEATLAAAGHKRGGARRAVLELLAQQRCALTAVEIEDALRARAPRPVSRASVYRILDELERTRLVARVETGQTMVRYERAHGPAGEHHHHLVCDKLRRGDALLRRRLGARDRRAQRPRAVDRLRARDRVARRLRGLLLVEPPPRLSRPARAGGRRR